MICDKMYLYFSNMMMWHVLIRGRKPKGLHQGLIISLIDSLQHNNLIK